MQGYKKNRLRPILLACFCAAALTPAHMGAEPEEVRLTQMPMTQEAPGVEIEDLRSFVPPEYQPRRDLTAYFDRLRGRFLGTETPSGTDGFARSETLRYLSGDDAAAALVQDLRRQDSRSILERFAEWINLSVPACRFDDDVMRDRVIEIAAIIDGMRDDRAIDAREDRFQRECFANFNPSIDYQGFEQSIINNIMADPQFVVQMRDNFAQWTPRDTWETRAEADTQYRLRAHAMRILMQRLRADFGLPNGPIHLMTLPDDIPLGGLYSPSFPGGAATLVNYRYGAVDMDTPQDMLRVVLEEIKHSIDYTYADMIQDREMASTDPRFPHAMMVLLNRHPATMVSFRRETQEDGSRVYHDLDAYRAQYAERTAKAFAATFTDRLLAAVAADPAVAQARQVRAVLEPPI